MLSVNAIEVVDRCIRLLDLLLAVQSDHVFPAPDGLHVCRAGRMLTDRERLVWNALIGVTGEILVRAFAVPGRNGSKADVGGLDIER